VLVHAPCELSAQILQHFLTLSGRHERPEDRGDK
jgi:hypothetical protein